MFPQLILFCERIRQLGSHTPNEITFPGACSSAVFLPLSAFKRSVPCVSSGTTGHTDIPKPQNHSNGPDELLAKGIS